MVEDMCRTSGAGELGCKSMPANLGPFVVILCRHETIGSEVSESQEIFCTKAANGGIVVLDEDDISGRICVIRSKDGDCRVFGNGVGRDGFVRFFVCDNAVICPRSDGT